jgi:predicted RNA-binding Zn ribbon-like protein
VESWTPVKMTSTRPLARQTHQPSRKRRARARYPRHSTGACAWPREHVKLSTERAGPGRVSLGRVAGEAAWTFHLGYGALCVDFSNTVSWRGSSTPVDHLPTYGELIRFAQQSKLLSEDDARQLRREATRRPTVATGALRKAVTLREALYRIFVRIADRRSPLAADVKILNASFPRALGHLRIDAADDGFAWKWRGDPQALDRLMWPIVRDAAVFLTSADFSRLRACANPQCRWIFHDGTRSGTRRWCSMAVCGNRAKVRRYYARIRPRRGGPAA